MAARPQPRAQARRTLHRVGPVAAVVLAVFWVRAGTPGGLPTDFMFKGGFLLCAALAALVVADARLVESGWFAVGLAWRPLHFIGTISYGIYLWHWPVIVYLNGTRTGLSTWPLDLLRVAVTLAVSTASYYLVERPIRLAKLRGGVRLWAPVAGVVTAVVIVFATIPAVADPSSVVGTTHLASTGSLQTVPGAGGYEGQRPIRLAPAPSPADPLRVDPRGLGHARRRLRHHRVTPGHRRGDSRHQDHRRVRSHHRDRLADLHPQPHTRDPGTAHRGLLELGPVRADHTERAAPAGAVHEAAPPGRVHHADAGQRRPGRDITQFPQSGNLAASSPADTASYNKERHAGVIAWNDIAEKMTSDFPGRVMYFPLADSVLLHGKYSAWLPPEGDPHAPSDQWLRVRKLDNVHLCPEGSARYAARCWRT